MAQARCLFLHEKQRLTLGQAVETRVAGGTASKCRTPEKVRSSSPRLPPVCLLFLPSVPVIPPFRDVRSKEKKTRNSPGRSPPSSPPTSAACTYRTFGHWTLNGFLVCELDECKHNQRGRKNKSVIARDSLCQHLSW